VARAAKVAAIQEASGFAAVFEAMRRARKPAVGHNCMFDVAYGLYSFADSYLPSSWWGLQEDGESQGRLFTDPWVQRCIALCPALHRAWHDKGSLCSFPLALLSRSAMQEVRQPPNMMCCEVLFVWRWQRCSPIRLLGLARSTCFLPHHHWHLSQLAHQGRSAFMHNQELPALALAG